MTNHPSQAVDRPRFPAWARVLLAAILFMPLASTPLLGLVVPAVNKLALEPSLRGALVLVVVFGIALMAYLLVSLTLVRWVDRRAAAALGMRISTRSAIAFGVGLLAALVLGVGGTAVAMSLGIGRDNPEAAESFLEYPDLALLILLLGQAFVLQGIGEEVLFRGYLLQSLNRWPRRAVFITAVAFALPHLSSQGGQESVAEHLTYLWVPFGFSISAAVLAIVCRSVWAAVGIHGGFHVATYLSFALGLTVQGPGLWVVLGTVHLALGLAVMALIPRTRWQRCSSIGIYE